MKKILFVASACALISSTVVMAETPNISGPCADQAQVAAVTYVAQELKISKDNVISYTAGPVSATQPLVYSVSGVIRDLLAPGQGGSFSIYVKVTKNCAATVEGKTLVVPELNRAQ